MYMLNVNGNIFYDYINIGPIFCTYYLGNDGIQIPQDVVGIIYCRKFLCSMHINIQCVYIDSEINQECYNL